MRTIVLPIKTFFAPVMDFLLRFLSVSSFFFLFFHPVYIHLPLLGVFRFDNVRGEASWPVEVRVPRLLVTSFSRFSSLYSSLTCLWNWRPITRHLCTWISIAWRIHTIPPGILLFTQILNRFRSRRAILRYMHFLVGSPPPSEGVCPIINAAAARNFSRPPLLLVNARYPDP